MAAFAAISRNARAQGQSCGGEPVSADAVRCPDGSIPSFSFDTAPPASGDDPLNDTDTEAQKVRPKNGGFPPGSVFGVWHTGMPGVSYASAIDVPGFYMMNIRPGIAPGDLTIDPNGAYTWNTIRGTSGRWRKGKEPTIILIDEVLGKRWLVTPVEDHIKIETDSQIIIGKR